MLFIIPTMLIMLLALIDFKKGFKLFLLFQMLWYPETQLVNIGSAWINLNFMCSTYLVILYFLRRNKLNKESERFPFIVPMCLIAISLLCTCLTSYSGFLSEFIKAISLIIMELLMVYIMWKTLNTKKDYLFLFKGITLIVLFACLYIFFEKITQLNPVLDYKITCTSNGITTYRDFIATDVRGYRCYSIFEHSICACMVFALYGVLSINLFVKYKRYPYRLLSLVTAGLCIPAMFFTQQRAGMFLFLIGIIPVINFKKKRFWKLVIIGLIALIAVWPLISDNIALLLSVFSTKYEKKVSGSSISMRLDQLDAIYRIMLEAPITGLGENFERFYKGIYATRAMGYESLWFEQMAKHGMMGVAAYLVMIFYSVYKIPKKYQSKELFFILLSYWMTYSLTSTPYFRTYLLYGIVFFFIKSSQRYDEKTQVHNSNKRLLIGG